jgi:glutaredoxin 3
MNQKAKVEIYTWDHCPYCQKTLALLNAKNILFEQHRLDGNEEARELMSQKTKENKKSVPQVFIDGVSIGGCDDTHALDASGELDKLVFA